MPEDNQHGNEPDSSQGKAEPQYVTHKQFGELVNKAIHGRFMTFETKLSKSVEESQTALADSIVERLSKAPNPPPKEGEGGDQGAGDDNAQLTAMQRKFERQMAEMERKVQTANEVSQRERQSALNVRLRQEASNALASAGVDGTRINHALGYLVDVEKRISYDDDNSRILFRDEDDMMVPLKDGVTGWSKSDDAKIYLPPRGAQGSGDFKRKKAPTPQGDSEAARKATILSSFGLMGAG